MVFSPNLASTQEQNGNESDNVNDIFKWGEM